MVNSQEMENHDYEHKFRDLLTESIGEDDREEALSIANAISELLTQVADQLSKKDAPPVSVIMEWMSEIPLQEAADVEGSLMQIRDLLVQV